ncbi:MAG: hypothetical protein AB7U29_16575 [Desulfobulbus sp.]
MSITDISILFNSCKVTIVPENQQFMAKFSAVNGNAGGFNRFPLARFGNSREKRFFSDKKH